jgi:MFS family permease
VAALLGPKLAERMSPRRVVQLGVLAVCVAALVLLGTVDVELDEPSFRVALAAFGAGAGLLASQLGNVIMSSVGPSRTSEAGGLQGTAQNLGASLGTALIGAILLTGLTTGFQTRVADDPAIPAQTREALTAATAEGVDIVPVSQVEAILTDAGLPPAEVAAVSDAYGQAQLDGLENAFLAIALLAVLALGLTGAIPARALSAPQDDGDAPGEPRAGP